MKYILSFIPVIFFLVLLICFDSFKLINKKLLLISICFGFISAIFAFTLANLFYFEFNRLRILSYNIHLAPFIEESFKCSLLVFLIYKNKIGFMIDGAIYGFAIGTGFALIENFYFIELLKDTSISTWLVRGFGTAVMHGGTCAIFSTIVIGFISLRENIKIEYFLPAIFVSTIIHSFYNNFFISPILSTIIIVILIPFILIVIFSYNEKTLQKWLEIEFDSEAKLLYMINKGQFSETKSGKYLVSIKDKFNQETCLDIFCYLKIYLELSLRAKANIMLSEANLPHQIYKDTDEKLKEFNLLTKNIGKTAIMSISPILRIKPKDIWKLNSLIN